MLSTSTEGESLEQIDKDLCKMTQDWIPEYRKKVFKNKSFCTSCKKYYDANKAELKEKLKTGEECVYSDAGYGDYDEYAMVTRKYTYEVCPLCGCQRYLKDERVSTGKRTQ